ncbi:Serine/threonine-protein kinase oca2 [Choanephora cucurbitarum]|uniref:non-specific serine/threonine protein kinase n=1 Tax=Choanephora cucurbitarum TaxID=101091 RepID=A0A1C7NLK1_9FUNG|nr:Serine/threonine-protein kinase oca2 [Choanephora cucurbitarum]
MATEIRSMANGHEPSGYHQHNPLSNQSTRVLTDKLNKLRLHQGLEDSTINRHRFENVTPDPSAPPSPYSESPSSVSPVSSDVHKHSLPEDAFKKSPSRSSTPSQFVFNKPAYDKHYHHTHFHHALEKKDTIFHDLKRFFKKGQEKKRRSIADDVSDESSSSTYSKHSDISFANKFNKNIESRYGKWGHFVGKGAGGSVRVIRRSVDGKTFAVKEFRKRTAGENQKEYVKKVTAEFCIGSTLHHPNVIETLDLIEEGPAFFEIMEYAPNDLFSVVMTKKMSSHEIECCWRQLLNGVDYLHSMGIAHRDLKLDNLVMDARGIIKIIDFGCATVFKYPFDRHVHLSKGVCGSDPYIAPELFTEKEYDARKADVWSCAIIYVCMVIRRFPWKAPRPDRDVSYQKFVRPESKGPQQLFDLLPNYTRSCISHILVPDPQERWLIRDVLKDTWVQSIKACTPEEPASNHPHHLFVASKQHLDHVVVLPKRDDSQDKSRSKRS